MSVLWWGIYFGCLGASLGALFGYGSNFASSSPGGKAVS
jgi:hypothetical protein